MSVVYNGERKLEYLDLYGFFKEWYMCYKKYKWYMYCQLDGCYGTIKMLVHVNNVCSCQRKEPVIFLPGCIM